MPVLRRLSTLALAVAMALVARRAAPTSVVAPTLDDLIARAESVVVAEVVDVHSSWMDSRSGRAIVTDVTVSIERTLKGPTYAQRSLEFLGGSVGDTTLRVSGMPAFHVGDRDVLFVRDSGRPASPLVGFMYGRVRIVRDSTTGVDTVRTHDGRPMASVADIGNAALPALVAPARPVSLDAFVSAVAARVRLLSR